MVNNTPHSEATKERISKSLKGTKRPKEVIEKSRKTMLEHYQLRRELGLSPRPEGAIQKFVDTRRRNNTFVIKEETKKKISASLTGKRHGMSGEFCKGNVPWNKGTKGLTTRNSGTFKKGHRPMNWRGGIRIVKNWGLTIATDEMQPSGVRKVKGLARHKWEQHYGEILTANDRIIHIDGDMYNNEISNLQKITTAENMARNRSKLDNHKIKKCIICGKDYLSTAPNSKTCSRECWKKNGLFLSKLDYEVRKNDKEFKDKRRETNRKYKLKLRLERDRIKDDEKKK